MQLHKIRGVNKQDLEDCKYTICVGVSLGNRWFTTENIIGLIRWSLEHSKNQVVVCPADDIHAINIEVRKRVGSKKASELAEKMSVEMLDSVRKKAEEVFSQEEQSRIVYATWSDLTDESFKNKVKWLYKYYEQDSVFKKTILDVVQNLTSVEDRDFSEKDIEKFGTYILEELPEVMGRVSIKDIVCDAYVYPFDGILTELIEDIQIGKKFPAVREKIMDTEPKVFLEVR